ncbi:MAG: Beta-ketoacyl synthase [Rickettsiaceae bacterium]|jgi:acyl transferase domain-containing protein|nr:Beta-ketoacyl synthase [Rickettsiaceae bacterium]
MVKKYDAAKEPIAVIGMSCIFPGAKDVQTFWQNILNGVNAIGEPLPEWEAERYLQSGRITTAQGGYLKDLNRFDPKEFGIMPNSVDGGEPDQLLALQVAKRALADAGEHYLDKDYNHRDTGIVLGHSTYYHRGQVNLTQHSIAIDQTMEILQAAMPMDEQQAEKIRQALQQQLPQFNADMCPSEVPNVMTGRIANRLNFTGPNYLIDAACASSLLAINAAIDELRKSSSRMMLAGGVNASLPAEVSMIFTMLDALSKRGKVRPFEEGGDGTLLGEGLGIVVLKRLSDALADGDRIYAVVHGVGQSSDGRGLGLLAPSENGETLAIRRAYESTGIDPETIGLIEAHGTGIALGDKTEIASLKNILGERIGENGSVAIGSVKSMISHCIPAAGMASFIKMCLSLHHKILPPTLCEKVNPALGIDKTPLYVNNTVKPWISKESEPCRAAINSFGFGGVNAHAILEEAPLAANKHLKCSPWNVELCVFAATDIDGLKAQLNKISSFIKQRDDVGISDIAYSLWQQKSEGECRLVLIAKDLTDLNYKIEQALKRLEKSDKPLLGKGGVFFSNKPVDGKLAFMFPGEGSQYINMLSDLAMHFAPVRQWFDFWHGLYDESKGSTRTDIIFPVNSELTDEKREQLNAKLHSMDIGSEAVFIAGQAMYSLLTYLGVKPDVMLGHSSGESSALAASGAMAYKNLEELGDFIRKLNFVYKEVEQKGEIVTGSLMAIALLSKEQILEHIEDSNIHIAMENCPTQTIVFGDKKSIAKLFGVLVENGAICEILPFDRGYHTPAFAPMQQAFARYYNDINLGTPQVLLYSCASVGLFPQDANGVKQLAAEQWSTTVRFIDTIKAMHADGVNYFIEVGPSGKLTSFAEQILRGKNCLIEASNVESGSGLAQLLQLMAKLYVNNKAGLVQLFAERDLSIIDFNNLAKPKPVGVFLHNTMPRLAVTPGLVAAIKPLSSRLAAGSEGSFAVSSDLPFFTEIKQSSDNSFLGYCRLNVNEQNFLQDHILSGTVSEAYPDLRGLPCVPLMVTLEIMAEACSTLAGNHSLTIIENVQTFNWIALDEGEVFLEVSATKKDENTFEAEVLYAGSKVMSAKFTFDQKNFALQNLPELDSYNDYNWPGEYELYQHGMFHGPIFQSIKHVQGWNENGIDATLSNISLQGFLKEGVTPKLILNPVLMDAISQISAFWIAQQAGTDFNSFPSKIERIELYANCPNDLEGLTLNARSYSGDINVKSWNMECVDGSGNVLVRVGGFNNVFFPVPNEFYRCRHDPLNGWIGNPIEGEEFSWYLQYLDESFCSQSAGIFVRIIAHSILSHTEREEWLVFNGDKRKWLFSRMCIKEAVRYFVYQQTGELLYPSDVIVGFENDTAYVDGWWTNELISAPAIHLEAGDSEAFVVIMETTAVDEMVA